ncbi:hypothetical protein ACWDSD_27080 [Streptomyces spiralis]
MHEIHLLGAGATFGHRAQHSAPQSQRADLHLQESPLARDDNNTLNTHAVLFDDTKTALVILGTGVALGAAAMKAAPDVKSGLISLNWL